MAIQATTVENVISPSKWSGPALATNTTANAFAAIAPTLTLPASDIGNGVAIVPAAKSSIKLGFFGEGADGNAFEVKIVAWSKVVSGSTGEFIPTALAHITCTMGTATGAAGGVIGGTGQLLVDTIVSTYAISGTNILSPADNIPATIEVPHAGAQFIGLYFDRSTATNANAIYMNV